MSVQCDLPALERRPLMVIGSMDVETDVLEGELQGAWTCSKGNYTFTIGEIDGYPVIVVRSFVGMVNAAAATALGISGFDPCLIISQGTAGGHNPDLHRGDIVIGRKVVNIHSVFTDRRALGEGIDPASWRLVGSEVVTDGCVVEAECFFGDERLVEVAKLVDYKNGKLACGILGSGDVWNREVDRIRAIRAKTGSDCEDMESFAVAHVCHQLGKPCLCFRIVSNSEFHPGETYDRAIGRVCQQYALAVVRKVIGSYFQRQGD